MQCYSKDNLGQDSQRRVLRLLNSRYCPSRHFSSRAGATTCMQSGTCRLSSATIPYEYSMRVISLLCAVQLTSFVFGSANSADQDGPPSLTLWDVGFSLRDAWAALRDIPCPAPLPGTVLHEPVPPDSNEVDQDIVSFEDWRRLRDLDGPEQHSQDEISAEARPDTAVPDALAQPINKYNYASPDCSARVLAFSSLTQHASSLLHKSRDRYMLTPCKAHDHWVVVELCDEIRIQAIELSVWEFFSGIVRDIKVSVGTELEDDLDWVTVDTFVGKNIRGAQVGGSRDLADSARLLHSISLPPFTVSYDSTSFPITARSTTAQSHISKFSV